MLIKQRKMQCTCAVVIFFFIASYSTNILLLSFYHFVRICEVSDYCSVDALSINLDNRVLVMDVKHSSDGLYKKCMHNYGIWDTYKKRTEGCVVANINTTKQVIRVVWT